MPGFIQIPALEIFLGILGFGFFILFCTTLCRMCHRVRGNRLEHEEWLRAREAGRSTSVFVIPVQGMTSSPSGEDFPSRVPPRYSQVYEPPRYSGGPPPSYSELGFKPEDLQPLGYTEPTAVPSYPMSPIPTPGTAVRE